MKSAWIRAAVIALAGLGAFALAGSFPEEPRFQAPVNLKVSESQVKAGQTLPLDVVLGALARSVGLQPLIYRAYDPSGDPAKAQPPCPTSSWTSRASPSGRSGTSSSPPTATSTAWTTSSCPPTWWWWPPPR